MTSTYDLTFKDWSDESSTASFPMTTLTAINITAELIEVGALRDATIAITHGTGWKDKFINNAQILNADLPTTPLAQRENKWLVRYHGVDNDKKWSLEIPCAALLSPTDENRLLPGSDFADLTQTEMAAFVSAFETTVRPPDSNTSLVVVDSIQFVGRNL